MRSKSAPRVLELCAGAGGQALGFEAAGFEHAILVDYDAHACATLRMNRPYWNVLQADIERFSAGYWEGVDVVAAGLPCPPFSVAGRQLGSSDERNLFPAFLRIVGEAKPQVAIVENVRGLLERRFSAYREQIVGEFAAFGFPCHWKLLDAFDQGVPQRRARSFLVALRESGEFRWPEANLSGETVGEALYASMAVNGWQGAEAWARKANRPAPTLVGGSHKHGGPDLGPTRARRAWAELGVDGLGLADDAPGPSFQGLPRLTVEMTSKLQSFPNDWKLAGGKTRRYRQVGNALPPKLAMAVARRIRSCLA
ncbi:MAG: DNA (cytosine-5-)-methyltransferase [Bryobacterales bacterium]|nr:DNA (cytosine-5-)-methyltransferase [Bryobacterales bacterium]